MIIIRTVAEYFNNLIEKRSNKIRLVSWVDACVEEHIVEPVSPRSKAAKKMEEDTSMPEEYKSQMLLDIHCGAQVKNDGYLESWF